MNKKSVGMLAVLGGLLIVSSARAGEVIAPGTVIFDMDTHTEFCDPDFWSFFGYPTVDFGSNGADSEDGTAVFTSGDWTSCDLVYGPSACQFLGAKHGGGRLCCANPSWMSSSGGKACKARTSSCAWAWMWRQRSTIRWGSGHIREVGR